MNAMGHVYKGVTLTLHGTQCVNYSDELYENEIHLFYLRFAFTSVVGIP